MQKIMVTMALGLCGMFCTGKVQGAAGPLGEPCSSKVAFADAAIVCRECQAQYPVYTRFCFNCGSPVQKPAVQGYMYARPHPQLTDRPKSALYGAFDASKDGTLIIPTEVAAAALLQAARKEEELKRVESTQIEGAPLDFEAWRKQHPHVHYQSARHAYKNYLRDNIPHNLSLQQWLQWRPEEYFPTGKVPLDFETWLKRHPRVQYRTYYTPLPPRVCDEFELEGIIFQKTEEIEYESNHNAWKAYKDYLRDNVPGNLSFQEWLRWRPKKYFSEQEVMIDACERLELQEGSRHMIVKAKCKAVGMAREQYEKGRALQIALDSFMANSDRHRQNMFYEKPQFEYWR